MKATGNYHEPIWKATRGHVLERIVDHQESWWANLWSSIIFFGWYQSDQNWWWLNKRSAGPSVEGPSGCEEVAWSSIFHFRLQWNHITALTFSYCHILDALKGQILILNVSSLMSQVLLDCLLYPKKRRHRLKLTISPGSGMTPESPWKFIDFRASLRNKKNYVNWPQGYPKLWKIDPGISDLEPRA